MKYSNKPSPEVIIVTIIRMVTINIIDEAYPLSVLRCQPSSPMGASLL